MSLSLIGPLDNNHVQRVLMVAAYAGVMVKVVPITDGLENKTEAYRLNISPLCRVPAMKTAEGYLSEPHAMIRYLARTEVMMTGAAVDASVSEKIPHPQYPVQYAMYGHSLLESSEVDAWLDFVVDKLDAFVTLFANAEVRKAPNSGNGFYAGDYRKPTERDRKQLFANLTALESRLIFLKETRKALVQQSGGSITARNYLEEELLMYGDVDESTIGGGAAKDRRVSTVYNVAGSIRSKMEEQHRAEKEKRLQEIKDKTDTLLGDREGSAESNGDVTGLDFSRLNRGSTRGGAITPRDSSALTPRMSVLTSARGTAVRSARGDSTSGIAGATGSVIQRQDLLFLVGDSLTAADLAMAMALHALYQVPSLKADAISHYAAVYRYYKSILMLPVAADMRKALKINLA